MLLLRRKLERNYSRQYWYWYMFPAFTKLFKFYIRLNVDVQMSDWQEGQAVKDEWKSFTMDVGEQSATIISTILMPALSATALVLGQYWHFKLKAILTIAIEIISNNSITVGYTNVFYSTIPLPF